MAITNGALALQKYTTMDLAEFETHFIDIGGQFLTSTYNLKQKLLNLEALVFDWEGVFNEGTHQPKGLEKYSAVDALGVKMIRYAYFLTHGKNLPMAVFSVSANAGATAFCQAENGQAVYTKLTNKEEALRHFCKTNGFNANGVAYFFDDTDDLATASHAGIKIAVGRLANPIFLNYVVENNLADYISAAQGNEHAVREFSELLYPLIHPSENLFKSIGEKPQEFETFLISQTPKKAEQWAEIKGLLRQIDN